MIEYKRETMSDVVDEIMPLVDEHHKEVDLYKDKIKVDVQWDTLESLEDLGMLYIFTMRDEGKLVGYNVFLVAAHMHYSQHDYAMNDLLYVHPAYRGAEYTPKFLKMSETYLKDEGVSVITYHMKSNKPFKALMEFLEYDHAEEMYSKYIGN